MIKEGIIDLNKPAGFTSHDCVNVIRRLTGIKRIGHTGTLDPNATGVLPVCIGSAARITEYLDTDLKTYKCGAVLGLQTDTGDIWGSILADERQKAAQIDDTGLTEAVLSGITGVSEQLPPMYSAVRVGGRRLYQYARAGETPDVKPRTIYVKDARLDGISVSEEYGGAVLSFTITCSKGTYIRTICEDIGRAFGTFAAMCFLERTATGAFRIEDSVTLDCLKALRTGEDVRDPETGRYIEYARADEERLNAYITPTDAALPHFGAVIVPENRARWFRNGGELTTREFAIAAEPRYAREAFPLPVRPEFRRAYRVYEEKEDSGRFLGVAFMSGDGTVLKADKVFAR